MRALAPLRGGWVYRGTSLIRNSAPLGPHSRTMVVLEGGAVLYELPHLSVVPLSPPYGTRFNMQYRGTSLIRNNPLPRATIGP